ncbi:hypothetical protein [Paenibacillus polysaccharolyticus]|uniref:hypothetical protein n=1 Tax=Paenibacillus polysaccharolyticus TaxID=582692 RepID=UPI00280A9677|nr:hypothetical protein [Paenibacillus polysaccharolyticus]
MASGYRFGVDGSSGRLLFPGFLIRFGPRRGQNPGTKADASLLREPFHPSACSCGAIF